MNTSIVKCVIAAALLVLPFVACAHHSNAEYDRNTVLELEGEIVEVVWRNPHVGLTIKTAGGGGAEALWKMEAADLIGTRPPRRPRRDVRRRPTSQSRGVSLDAA